MGAQNARMLVKNQWRTKTTSSVFLVRIHVCLTIAPAMVALAGKDRGPVESSSVESSRVTAGWTLIRGVGRGLQVLCY